MADLLDKPTEQKTEIVNPVLKDLDISKGIFRDQMEKSKPKEETPKPVEPPVISEPPKEELKKEEKKPAPTPEKAAKPKLPEDIFVPASDDKEKPKPSEAITELDSLKLPEGAKSEQLASFGVLKEKSKSHISRLETELQELRSQLTSVQKNGDTETLRNLVKEANDKYVKLEEDFGKSLFERSPRFQQQFILPENDAIASAKANLEGTDVDPGIIESMLHLTPVKRRDIMRMAGVEPELMAPVLSALAGYDNIQKSKQREIENWKGNTERWQQEDAKAQQEQQAAELAKRQRVDEKDWNEALAELSGDKQLPPYMKHASNEEWNKAGEMAFEAAKKKFFREATGKEVALNMLKAEAYDHLVKYVLDPALEQNANLKTENKNLKASKPGGEITQGHISETEAEKHKKMSPLESAKAVFRSFQPSNQG